MPMKIILYPEIGVRFFCQDKNASTTFEEYFAARTTTQLVHWDESTLNFRARFNRSRREVLAGQVEIEFSIVRNTWARIASLYHMLHQQVADDTLHVWFSRMRVPLIQALTSPAPFRNLVEFICTQRDEGVDSHWQPQVQGLPFASEKFHILRLETLATDLKRCGGELAEIDVTALSHANRTGNSTQDYRQLYDPGSVELVRRRYWKEIELFGFQF